MWMPRVPKRLLDSPSWVWVEKFWLRAEELSVAVDRSREGLREPVEGCAIEHLILRWSLVRPLLELLADPEYRN